MPGPNLDSDGFAVDGAWPTMTQGAPVTAEIGAEPEDFQVDELDAYPCSGQGEHLFIRVQKRGISTQEACARLARGLGLQQREIGFAGRKDARGLTTQRFSVPRRVEPQLAEVEDEALNVLETQAHGNKLRVGHLSGNSFKIRVLLDDLKEIDEVQRRAAMLQSAGMPNYFGAQRFGPGFRSAADGFDLLARGRGRRDRRRDGFLISAAQSVLFNDYVAHRMRRELFLHALEGDVLKTERGGLFICDDVSTDSERLVRGEIRVTGPMFGRKMKPALSSSLTLESEILAARNLELAIFSSYRPPIPGTRRPVVVSLAGLRVDPRESATEVSFSLPAGSFATMALRELFRIQLDV